MASERAQLNLLKEISSKLDILPEIREQLKNLNNVNTKEIVEIKTKLSEISEEFMLGRNSLTPMTSYADILLKERATREITTEAYQYRKLNKRKWGHLKNRRKHAYYNSIKAVGTSVIYTEFLQKDNPFIPRKYKGQSTDLEEAK